jgi:hypothetical protein
MKTKDEAEKVEKLRSRGVEEWSGKSRHTVPVTLREAPVGFSTPQPLDSWTAELREQSENVYENKGLGENCRGACGGCGSGASAPQSTTPDPSLARRGIT